MSGVGEPMAVETKGNEEFERRARSLLEQSLTHVNGHVRSRLNQARQAALAEVSQPRPLWRRVALMPAAGALAAAVLMAIVLWPHSHQLDLPLLESGRASAEDLDLLADGDGPEMVSEDSAAAFYEWAVDQTQGDGSNETSS